MVLTSLEWPSIQQVCYQVHTSHSVKITFHKEEDGKDFQDAESIDEGTYGSVRRPETSRCKKKGIHFPELRCNQITEHELGDPFAAKI